MRHFRAILIKLHVSLKYIFCSLKRCIIHEGLDGGGVSNSLISKNLAHYSLSLKFLLIL